MQPSSSLSYPDQTTKQQIESIQSTLKSQTLTTDIVYKKLIKNLGYVIMGINNLVPELQCDSQIKAQLALHKTVISLNHIYNLYDYLSFQSGIFQVKLSQFSLQSLINDLQSIYQPILQKFNIAFSIECKQINTSPETFQLNSDKRRIIQILINIINLALRSINSNKKKFNNNNNNNINNNNSTSITTKIQSEDTAIPRQQEFLHIIFTKKSDSQQADYLKIQIRDSGCDHYIAQIQNTTNSTPTPKDQISITQLHQIRMPQIVMQVTQQILKNIGPLDKIRCGDKNKENMNKDNKNKNNDKNEENVNLNNAYKNRRKADQDMNKVENPASKVEKRVNKISQSTYKRGQNKTSFKINIDNRNVQNTPCSQEMKILNTQSSDYGFQLSQRAQKSQVNSTYLFTENEETQRNISSPNNQSPDSLQPRKQSCLDVIVVPAENIPSQLFQINQVLVPKQNFKNAFMKSSTTFVPINQKEQQSNQFVQSPNLCDEISIQMKHFIPQIHRLGKEVIFSSDKLGFDQNDSQLKFNERDLSYNQTSFFTDYKDALQITLNENNITHHTNNVIPDTSLSKHTESINQLQLIHFQESNLSKNN